MLHNKAVGCFILIGNLFMLKLCFVRFSDGDRHSSFHSGYRSGVYLLHSHRK